ncbi:MAG: hypothetical protein ALAOOOJD_03876 [bacterium]|nr:hypothetical protein [bacterium]
MNSHTDHLDHSAAHKMHNAKDKTHAMEHGVHVDVKDQQPLVYNVNLQTDPAKPMANTATQLAITVTEQAVGDAIQEFELVHDKPMHLIIVRDDLSYFDHLHLEPQNGVFTTPYSFPHAGDYKLWVDVKPQNGRQLLAAFRIHLEGRPLRERNPLAVDNQFTQIVMNGQYRVSLALPSEFGIHHGANLKFSIADTNGKPITDLQPMLGAKAHCIIISQDIHDFLHVHPEEEVSSSWRGGPDATFHAQFPKAGLYKTWVQFQHHGKTITADFVVQVK